MSNIGPTPLTSVLTPLTLSRTTPELPPAYHGGSAGGDSSSGGSNNTSSAIHANNDNASQMQMQMQRQGNYERLKTRNQQA
ncbi:hypothetical protein SLS62_008475 [Diatrype stigma]|uniref:Uncharacterized protein n=1 Tax=Diatrype stigma TaxID=117547 RepID=A0AAN9UMG6_9PEZI